VRYTAGPEGGKEVLIGEMAASQGFVDGRSVDGIARGRPSSVEGIGESASAASNRPPGRMRR